MKNITTILIIIVVLVLAGSTFYFWQNSKKDVNQPNITKQENEINNFIKEDGESDVEEGDSFCKVDSECDGENDFSSDLNLKSCADNFICEEGYTCYHSQYSGMGPNGLVVGEEEGDLKCHKICVSNNDCDKDSECKNIEIIGGDVVIKQNMCV